MPRIVRAAAFVALCLSQAALAEPRVDVGKFPEMAGKFGEAVIAASNPSDAEVLRNLMIERRGLMGPKDYKNPCSYPAMFAAAQMDDGSARIIICEANVSLFSEYAAEVSTYFALDVPAGSHGTVFEDYERFFIEAFQEQRFRAEGSSIRPRLPCRAVEYLDLVRKGRPDACLGSRRNPEDFRNWITSNQDLLHDQRIKQASSLYQMKRSELLERVFFTSSLRSYNLLRIRSFLLLHEVGHVIAGDLSEFPDLSTDEGKCAFIANERAADEYAAAMLRKVVGLPENELARVLMPWTLYVGQTLRMSQDTQANEVFKLRMFAYMNGTIDHAIQTQGLVDAEVDRLLARTFRALAGLATQSSQEFNCALE